MEKKDYSPLFTPFKIGKMEVKNRIVLSPMVITPRFRTAPSPTGKSTIMKSGPGAAPA